jgi:hypothetical protein
MTDFYVISGSRSFASDERLMNLLESWKSVQLPICHEEFNDMLLWCLEHCQNKFRDMPSGQIRTWYFENDQDLTMFLLKWSFLQR